MEEKDRIIELSLPRIGESLTIKMAGSISLMGTVGKTSERYVCPVRIFGPKEISRQVYRMDVGVTLWHSLYESLKFLEEIADEVVDDRLECLSGRIITIHGIEAPGGAGAGTGESEDFSFIPKIFRVNIRDDLFELERTGSPEEVIEAWNKETKYSRTNDINECIARNLRNLKAVAMGQSINKSRKRRNKSDSGNEKHGVLFLGES